ncbi:hypothetical protein K474DRAFT_1709756 [Panus rudis PR-1116 ss-1]|nr:hypothetical protein K474DRAFT_1709756 [Panus rudis PR-1116 ss-1]
MARTTYSQSSGVDKPLTPAQKAALTRARNRQEQEIADRRLLNETREPRYSKVKGRARVNAPARRSPQPSKRSVHVPTRTVKSCEEDDPHVPLKRFRHSAEYSGPPSRNAYTSEDEMEAPAEKSSRSRRQTGRNYDPAVRDDIAEPQKDEEEDAASVAEEEEERRNMSDVDRASDGEGEEAEDEDLEALAGRPEALKAALQQEMPHIMDANQHESPEDNRKRKRKTVPRRFLDEGFEEDAQERHEQEPEVPQEECLADNNDAADGPAYEEEDIDESNSQSVPEHHHPSESAPHTHRSSAAQVHARQQGRRAQARIAERANPDSNTVELHSWTRPRPSLIQPASQPTDNSAQQTRRWPLETDLLLSRRSMAPITKQNAWISAVGHAAIDAFYADLMFRTTLPTATQKDIYHQSILEDCTRQLQDESGDKVYKYIRHRIRQDTEYTKVLVALAIERVHNRRCSAKKAVLAHLEGEYGLVSGGRQRFAELADKFIYIFPVDHQNNIVWLRPFMRKIFSVVIFSLFFAGPNPFAARYASRSPKINGQTAIPQGMVCFVAVVIYMTMHDVAYDGMYFSIQDKAANWDAEYKAMWDFAEGFKARSPRLFSDLMIELYQSASRGQELQPRVMVVDEVLAQIDFSQVTRNS